MSVFSPHAIANIPKLHLHSVMKLIFLCTLDNPVSCRLFPCDLTLKGSTAKKTTENLYVFERSCSPLKQKLTISAFGLSQNQREKQNWNIQNSLLFFMSRSTYVPTEQKQFSTGREMRQDEGPLLSTNTWSQKIKGKS